MKTFATLALMAVAAYSAQIDAENPYHDLFHNRNGSNGSNGGFNNGSNGGFNNGMNGATNGGNNGMNGGTNGGGNGGGNNGIITNGSVIGNNGNNGNSKEHTHTHPTVHVDVWDTIDTELMELMNDITALMTQVDTQGNTLMSAQLSFSQLMQDVAELRQTNGTNSANLAGTKAVDASQDAKLQQLVNDIGSLEHKVSELANATALLKLRVGDLPDFAGINDRLAAIVVKNMTLMMDAMTQAETLAGIEQEVDDAQVVLDAVLVTVA